MKKLVRASLLILVVSCATYAGVMPTPGPEGEMPFPVEPTPTPAQVSTQESTTSNAQGQGAVESAVTEAVLNLITSVLVLF